MLKMMPPFDNAESKPSYSKLIDFIKISLFGLALSALWNGLNVLIIPLRILDLVNEAQKSTYLSFLVGSGLLLAILVQPMVGALSDHLKFSWGRRRPFILLGGLLVLIFLPGITMVSNYPGLFIVYCLLQISSNTAQSPYQGFIPDLVPEERRGVASGVKTILELIGGLAFVQLISFLVGSDRLGTGGPWLWLPLGSIAAVLLLMLLPTIFLIKESPRMVRAEKGWLLTAVRGFKINLRTDSSFLWFLVSRLLVLTAFTTLQKFALFFLRDTFGLIDPVRMTANLVIIVGLSTLIAAYLAGHFSDRIGRRVIGISSGLLGVVGLLILFFSHNFTQVLVGGSIAGLASGTFMSVNWALATDLVPRGEEARFLGLTNFATAGSSAVTLFIVGPLIDFFNAREPGLGYSVMFLSCIVYVIAGTLMLLKVRRNR
jgi:Na+/melibiose symporter-like transporter